MPNNEIPITSHSFRRETRMGRNYNDVSITRTFTNAEQSTVYVGDNVNIELVAPYPGCETWVRNVKVTLVIETLA